MDNSMQVRLGTQWSRFTYQRDDMQLLGTVQQGAQIGALARLEGGHYAQVNGDVIQRLNTKRVEHALRAAGPVRPNARPAIAPPRPATPPTVVVRKRRRVDVPRNQSDAAAAEVS